MKADRVKFIVEDEGIDCFKDRLNPSHTIIMNTSGGLVDSQDEVQWEVISHDRTFYHVVNTEDELREVLSQYVLIYGRDRVPKND